jgi:hypothetical protein
MPFILPYENYPKIAHLPDFTEAPKMADFRIFPANKGNLNTQIVNQHLHCIKHVKAL